MADKCAFVLLSDLKKKKKKKSRKIKIALLPVQFRSFALMLKSVLGTVCRIIFSWI